MNTNLAIDMTDNQSNTFDLGTFLSKPGVKSEILKKINTYVDTNHAHAINDAREILSNVTLMYLECLKTNHNYQSEEGFWQWFNQNLKAIRKVNQIDNNTWDVDSFDGGNISDDNYENNYITIVTTYDTPETKVIEKENAELEETSDSEIKVIDLRKIIINWLNKIKTKTEEWQKIKEWEINALNTDNTETRKHAIILSKMTDRQREVWIVTDYHDINQIGKSNQITIADYVSIVTGNHITRQSLKSLIRRAAIKAGIDLIFVKGLNPSKPKPKKRANVIPIADFIKQHKQLDFNFNHQESKIVVTNNKNILLYASKAVFELKNKVVSGCSSGYSGKESVFSPSANGLNTAIYHGNISSNNIDLNNLKINNKKTSSESKILSINAFIEKNINSKTNSDNNTFCQVISINQGIHHSDQSPFIFNKKSIHKDKPVFKKDKWSSDMFARYGP